LRVNSCNCRMHSPLPMYLSTTREEDPMRNPTLALLLASGLFVTACAATPEATKPAAGADKAAVEAMIAEAKANYDKILKANRAWRDNEKLIKAAEEALAKGDLAAAEKNAKAANLQATEAWKQYEAQKGTAGPWNWEAKKG